MGWPVFVCFVVDLLGFEGPAVLWAVTDLIKLSDADDFREGSHAELILEEVSKWCVTAAGHRVRALLSWFL